MTLTIAIGSTNPVKIAAVESVLRRAFPAAQFISMAVPSGVPNQPWGDDETRQGAENRARAARAVADAGFGVGLEGGLVETPVGWMTCAWCAMVGRNGNVGYGGGVRILLPPPVVANLKLHGELGPAMDALVDEHNTKQGRGAIGILTNGLIDRQAAYEQLVAMAAAPFVTDYYHA